jgi:phospholipid-translocating ATPase
VKVGDILVLKNKNIIPADCIVLSTDDINGECYVQTDALDGERNLKPKRALI